MEDEETTKVNRPHHCSRPPRVTGNPLYRKIAFVPGDLQEHSPELVGVVSSTRPLLPGRILKVTTWSATRTGQFHRATDKDTPDTQPTEDLLRSWGSLVSMLITTGNGSAGFTYVGGLGAAYGVGAPINPCFNPTLRHGHPYHYLLMPTLQCLRCDALLKGLHLTEHWSRNVDTNSVRGLALGHRQGYTRPTVSGLKWLCSVRELESFNTDIATSFDVVAAVQMIKKECVDEVCIYLATLVHRVALGGVQTVRLRRAPRFGTEGKPLCLRARGLPLLTI
uniref:Uncharacterized protein n=1 Tax=Timema bartmani TaxID=61472 RepID=A0A7R9HZ64_9NEOP|nr:unnamed protein product [Timema bartmani]